MFIIVTKLIIFSFCISLLSTEMPVITWTKSFGKYGNESIKLISQTFDKGYIILGTTSPFGSNITDIYLLKTDKNCDPMWTKTYGGVYDDFGNSIVQTSDSSYIISGRIWLRGWDGDDMLLLKVNSNGDIEWSKKYGEIKRNESALSIVDAYDGNYVILADSGSVSNLGHFDAHFIEINGNGDIIREKNISTTNINDVEFGAMMQRTEDQGYIITGSIWREEKKENSYDIWLEKIAAEGDVIWYKTFGSIGQDEGRGVQQTSDEGYIVVGCIAQKIPLKPIRGDGWITYKGSQTDIYLIKTDSNGDTLWSKTYGGDEDENAYSVQETSDGGYIVGGYTESFSVGGKDIYIIKTDAFGNRLWSMTYGGLGDDRCLSITEAWDGGYIAGCNSNSFGRGDTDIYLIRIVKK